jgi:hypothetical protein
VSDADPCRVTEREPQGVSATASGLQILPLVAGLLVLVPALRNWLAHELADRGADDPELDRALAHLATDFVEQNPNQVPGR